VLKGLLMRSMERNEKIVIFYVDSEGRLTERYVRILKMEDTAFLAYCYYRRKVRQFKLERILSAGPARGRVGA